MNPLIEEAVARCEEVARKTRIDRKDTKSTTEFMGWLLDNFPEQTSDFEKDFKWMDDHQYLKFGDLRTSPAEKLAVSAVSDFMIPWLMTQYLIGGLHARFEIFGPFEQFAKRYSAFCGQTMSEDQARIPVPPHTGTFSIPAGERVNTYERLELEIQDGFSAVYYTTEDNSIVTSITLNKANTKRTVPPRRVIVTVTYED